MEQIKQKMNKLLEELDSSLVLKMASHLQSGKMLRSKLILNITKTNEESILLCAIIEMIQNASLLHDDVIDNALMRRNKPSLNALSGDKNAIMLGDVLYSKAFCELIHFAKNYPQIPKIIAGAVSTLAIGEIMDVALGESFNENEEEYLKMIEYKTASLIEASATSSAILAGFNENEVNCFKLYGKNLGIAFQIVDDILDLTQNEKTLGKPVFSDFKEGKTTLPLIYLYKSLNTEDKEKLKSLFKKDLNTQEKAWLQESLHKSGAIQKSMDLAKNLGKSGIEAIYNKNCDKLTQIMQQMIDREF
ncbi:polyprenyl synthetase family protein [Helicobacter burdigaliensis]|uniref:polyprenyl synthetase family protein n=1 Tax=Helicobacter burdigaliensis TaxID=2315334 RepID=UPI0013004CE1